MVSKTRDGDTRKSKGKILGFIKRIITQKTKIENKESTGSQHYEFDALPTPGGEHVGSQQTSQPNNNSRNENQRFPGSTNFNNRCNDGFQSRNENRNNFTPCGKAGRSENVQNQFIVSDGAVGVQIIGTYTSNVYTQNNFVNGKPNVGNRKLEETKKIKALLKSRDPIKQGHLEFLSRYLESKWRDIGKTLGLSEEDLQSIKERCKKHNLKEKAYKVLFVWWYEKRRECAAIGELCEILWEGDISTAWDAVHHLSLKIELFK